ncbi:MAG: T9SS type A sorting domain-containing protein [Cyclobacteriaceae bacterium]
MKYLFFFVCLGLSISAIAQELNCYNGIDDDGDGLVDCFDGDCSGHIVCNIEFICDDGIDNDGDGLIDCEDPDCPSCATEICNDGIDNDGDGLIDCQDRADCGASLSCTESDCGNGIDDDGDGLYDYYDSDCASSSDNPNYYIGAQSSCSASPMSGGFSMQAADSSANQTSAAFDMPMVADVDNDGTPEVITTNAQNGTIYILNGADLSDIEYQTDHGSNTFGYPTVGDVNGDGFGEIFLSDLSGNIKAYTHDLSSYWGSKTSVYNKYGRALGLADFDLDGNAELYQVNEIRDAITGEVLIAGSHGSTMYPSANDWETELNVAPVAIDMLPDAACTDCKGLELVVGHIIYSVDLAGGKLTEVMNMDDATTLPADYRAGGYYPKHAGWSGQTYSSTSIADFNSDGYLDVLLGGTTGDQYGPTSVFFWDLQNDEVKMFIVSRLGSTINGGIKGTFKDLNGGGCDNSEQCTWQRGVGTLSLANIDDDAELEVVFVSGSSLYALDQDFNLEWANHDQFWESSSGFTGNTIYDFDGDGASEIIYRDEVNLYIIDGTTGMVISDLSDGSFCSSQTRSEYPIVADVDGDGETEIIISCGQARNIYGSSPATSVTRENAHIKVYEAADDSYWVPARSVWNQFAYHNTNINDDLTIPKIAQPHHISFSQTCQNGGEANFPLNKFLSQSARLDNCGNPVVPAAKLDFLEDSIRITPPLCPEQEFQVRLYFENNGDKPVTQAIPVSFYCNNPQQAYADTDPDPHFEVVYLNMEGGLQPGGFLDTTLTMTGPQGEFTLYPSLNDLGPYDSQGNKMNNSEFYPHTNLNGTVRECDDSPSIFSIDVTAHPFEVVAVKLRDNRNCPGAMANTNNGEVQVFAADSTVLPESDYDITWTHLATGDVVGSSALVTELDSGTYRVEVLYNDGVYTCQGMADTVRVERFEDWPDTEVITLEMIQPVSGCAPGTADGQARILLNGSSISETDYLIEWEDEQQAGVLAVGDTATNLKPILYKVTVTNLQTGCSEAEIIDMTLDQPEIDDLVITDNTNCKNPNGNVTIQMVGSVTDYDYMLIQHSPVQDTIFSDNPSFNGLGEGIFEVRAYDPIIECGLYTSGETFEIKTISNIDDITIQVVQEQTSCAFPYNGQLSAVTADPSEYDWVWYRGTVTSGPTAEVVATDYFTPDTLSANLTNVYTVVATKNSSGCTFSESIMLTESIPTPVINVDLQHQTNCNTYGQAQISVGASKATTGHRFTLQQGGTVIDTNFTGLFTELEVGPYQVIAEDTATNCVSTPSTVFEIENQVPAFGNIAFTETPQTNCDPASPNGALSITVDGSTVGYTFKWFAGEDTAKAVVPQPATSDQLAGVEAGNYAVRIHNLATECDTLVYTILTDATVDYQATVTATVLQGQIYCTSGVFSGQIEAGLLPSSAGETPDTANYNYYWYEGAKSDVRSGSASLIVGQNRSIISGLDVGWYSVRAVRTDEGNCAALDTAEVFIEDMRDAPLANINVTVVNQSSCDSSEPNGELYGNVAGNTTDYSFIWYEVIDGVDREINVANYPNIVFTDTSIANVGVGTYVLEVQHVETGCMGREAISLNEELPTASFSYAQSSYCQQETNPVPAVDTPGGTFSAFAGLVVDATTGEIDLAASVGGTYTVTYAMPNACPETGNFTLTIHTESDASFRYNRSFYYLNESNPLPLIEGDTGGTFTTDDPASLVIDSATGEIDLGASNSGVYTITYTLGGACPANSAVEIVLLEVPTLSVSRATICADEEIELSATGRNAEENYQWEIVTADDIYFGIPDSVRTAQSFAYPIQEVGVYEARVTLSNPYAVDTVLVTTFVVEALPEITLPESLNLFEDSLALQAIDATTNDIEKLTFTWSHIMENDTILAGNEHMLWVDEPGFYHLKVETLSGCYAEAQTFVVDNRPLTQTITFDSIPNKAVGDPSFRLSASSALPVQFEVVAGAAHVFLQGDTLSIISAGTVAIQATQSGNEQYQSADTVYRTFEIKEAPTTEVSEDTLYHIEIHITAILQGKEVKAELYQRQQGITHLVKQISVTSDQSNFSELEAGEYTVKLMPQVNSLLNTYMGQHLLLSEATWISLTQDTTASIDPIAIPKTVSEHGVILSGVFVESSQAGSGRIELTTKQSTSGEPPIVDMIMYLVDAQEGSLVAVTITDDKGRFSFANVPPGTYRIKADYKGLEVDASSVVTIADQPLEVILTAGDKISLITLTESEQQVTGIEAQLLPDIKLYPNPVEDVLDLQLPLSMVGSNLKIFSANGQLVFTKALNTANVKCSLSHLSSGQYQLQISYQGNNYLFKILKE